MTIQEFSKKYKIHDTRAIQLLCPGLGIRQLIGPHATGVISVEAGSGHVLIAISYFEEEFALQTYRDGFFASAMHQSVQIKLDHINTLLSDLSVPIVFQTAPVEGPVPIFLLYNKASNVWTFRLAYVYKTPEYAAKATLQRSECTTWQEKKFSLETYQSNTLEGKYDPDSLIVEDHIKEDVRLLTENL